MEKKLEKMEKNWNKNWKDNNQIIHKKHFLQ